MRARGGGPSASTLAVPTWRSRVYHPHQDMRARRRVGQGGGAVPGDEAEGRRREHHHVLRFDQRVR